MSSVQVSAHGFELTEALRDTCVEETEEKMQSLACSNFHARWVLSIESINHVAHVTWGDGSFHGDATVKSDDMYLSISRSAKTAHEQIKKAHEKRFNHHRPVNITFQEPELSETGTD